MGPAVNLTRELRRVQEAHKAFAETLRHAVKNGLSWEDIERVTIGDNADIIADIAVTQLALSAQASLVQQLAYVTDLVQDDSGEDDEPDNADTVVMDYLHAVSDAVSRNHGLGSNANATVCPRCGAGESTAVDGWHIDKQWCDRCGWNADTIIQGSNARMTALLHGE